MPTILRPRVCIPSTTSTLFKFVFELWWEKDNNKQKEVGIGPFFKMEASFFPVSETYCQADWPGTGNVPKLFFAPTKVVEESGILKWAGDLFFLSFFLSFLERSRLESGKKLKRKNGQKIGERERRWKVRQTKNVSKLQLECKVSFYVFLSLSLSLSLSLGILPLFVSLWITISLYNSFLNGPFPASFYLFT